MTLHQRIEESVEELLVYLNVNANIDWLNDGQGEFKVKLRTALLTIAKESMDAVEVERENEHESNCLVNMGIDNCCCATFQFNRSITASAQKRADYERKE